MSNGLPQAVVGRAYEEAVHAVGGLRPYDFSLVEGKLPPGLELQSGAIRGTPSATGQFTFTVQVSDANLSKTVQRYSLQVVEVPPPRLTLSVPQTEVQRRLTLRVGLADATGFTGLRTDLTWDADLFQLVPGSVRAARGGLGLVQRAGAGSLQVALVPLGRKLDGAADLFTFDLEPVSGASFLQVDAAIEFAGDTGHHYQTLQAGRAPPTAPPASGGEPASGAGSAPPPGPGLPGAPAGGQDTGAP